MIRFKDKSRGRGLWDIMLGIFVWEVTFKWIRLFRGRFVIKIWVGGMSC